MEINDLTPAELQVWNAFPRGEVVDFRPDAGEDAATGAGWGPERTLRASVLKALLVSAPQEDGEIAALRVLGARITGGLDLTHGVVDHPIRLAHCYFTGLPDLYNAQLRRLSLRGSVLPALDLGGARVEGVVRLTECRINGPVHLSGAQISGALLMERAELTARDEGEPVLKLTQAAIGDELSATGLRATGEVRLNGAHVSGSINLDGARLSRPGRLALDAVTLGVDGDVLLRRVEVDGWIGLRGARIAGRLDLSYARLSNPGDMALRATSCSVGELWLRRGDPLDGGLNLRRAQVDVLFVEPEKLPDKVRLDGLGYTTLTPHEPAERRLPMLEREVDGYVPYVYEQLTAVYRRIGDDNAARLVQLAKQRRHRTTLPWYGRLWGHVQDATVGYGFRPMRALGWLLSLLAVGSVSFALHTPAPLKADEAPQFNPVFYTLDLLLPVISFGQEPAFAPQGGQQWLSYVLILTGWILATTVIAGVTRTVSRQ
ncbi:membrane-associated oxidoreductase [Streptomyces sp. AS02]|uniref:membrane-associated oxidoreductase n=1 Tax=Streptomyces sp. AS02 TaxID=2938946 RepID=UPI00202056AE|nr:membrane-associated oxidoreductase [Streptomyces sp. AS02]MCL8013696.1 membrane-associated oxidoreductase [Streptomyces sp. AS02]